MAESVSTYIPPTFADDPRVAVRSDAMYRIHEVSRLISTYFDQSMAQHGITRAQWTAIMHISQNPGSTQTELADLMQLGRAATGKMLERLEQKNFIVRNGDETDSRLRRVYPHEDLQRLTSFIPEAAVKLYDAFYRDMDDADIDALYSGLMAMRSNALSALGKVGTPTEV
jgi:MarR family transcriptional regulator for hemolysin